MLEFTSLYSGSSGNSLLLESNNTKLLIDVGMSCKKINDALETKKLNLNDIDGILITHEHIDHVRGLNVISKKYNIPLYTNSKTWKEIDSEYIKTEYKNEINYKKEFVINDLKIVPFEISHDAVSPSGFNIYHENKKISVATDLGCVTEEVYESLKESSFMLLESNYELEVLKSSRYPYYLKQRINSNIGHLSNDIAAKVIAKLTEYGLEKVMLGHLSKENNMPELAYKTVSNATIEKEIKINIEVAPRNGVSKTIII